MTAPCFVDADVLISARDPGDPLKQARARQWLEHLWREGLGRTSLPVLTEFYVHVTRKLATPTPLEDAWEEITTLFAWKPQPVDVMLIGRAREIEQRWRLPWRDAMVVAAAQLQGCAILLTGDLPDGATFGGVTVRSPYTLDVREPLPVYAAVPALASRHRGRGRPRKRPLPAAA